VEVGNKGRKRKEKIPSGIYFFHKKTERLPGFVVFKRQILKFLNYGPVAAVVGEVKVTGVDVSEAKRWAANVPRVVNVRQDVTIERILPSRSQVDRGCGALNNVSANSSECHFSLRVKGEKLLPKRI
jgi:hypothetical protein